MEASDEKRKRNTNSQVTLQKHTRKHENTWNLIGNTKLRTRRTHATKTKQNREKKKENQATPYYSAFTGTQATLEQQ